ncbi:hypothetical protein GmHk_01G000440 [Glycine max]|nr:hypothetical protein GmHk_01G000440 [Glycine max]
MNLQPQFPRNTCPLYLVFQSSSQSMTGYIDIIKNRRNSESETDKGGFIRETSHEGETSELTLKRFIKNKNEKNVIVKGGARDAICAIKVVAATTGEDNIDRIEKKNKKKILKVTQIFKGVRGSGPTEATKDTVERGKWFCSFCE